MENDTANTAVRWPQRMLRRRMNDIVYTTWHWTDNGNQTICGWPIRIWTDGIDAWPDHIDEVDGGMKQVKCKICIAKLKREGRLPQ